MDRRCFVAGLGAAAAAATTSLVGPALGASGTVRMRDLYNLDQSFSDFATATEGQRLSVRGFMAPPLKAEATFFVLTKRPMAVCPFCESSADWPLDILAVYTKRTLDVVPFNVPLVTSGTLALGEFTDPETGFVSKIRLMDATYERS